MVLVACTSHEYVPDLKTDIEMQSDIYPDYINTVTTIDAGPVEGATMDIAFDHMQGEFVILSYTSPTGDHRIPIDYDQYGNPIKFRTDAKPMDIIRTRDKQIKYINDPLEPYLPIITYDGLISASNFRHETNRYNNYLSSNQKIIAKIQKQGISMEGYSQPTDYQSPFPESNMSYLEKRDLDNYISQEILQ